MMRESDTVSVTDTYLKRRERGKEIKRGSTGMGLSIYLAEIRYHYKCGIT
jgi:hypothetical protein